MKTKLFIFLIVLSISSNAKAQRKMFEINENPKSTWKNPGATAALSFFIPGTGYFANDMMKEGFITFGSEIVLSGIASAFLGAKPTKRGYYTDFDNWGFPIQKGIDVPDEDKIRSNRNIAYAFLALAGAIHLFQFSHSAILTNKSNIRNGFAHTGKKKIDMTFGVQGDGLAFSLRF